MKVLIPVIGFGKSGGYRVLSMLANEIMDRGIEVSFVSSVYSSEPHFPTKANIFWVTGSGDIASPKDQPGNFIQHLLALHRALGKEQLVSDVDIILANQSFTALAIPKNLRSKTVYYAQAYEPDYYYAMGGLKNLLLAKLSERSYKLGLFTVVNSPVFMNFKLLKSNRVLIPGIDQRHFFSKKLGQTAKKDVTLGTIGRRETFKGSAIILEAFKILSSKHPDWKLKLAFGTEVSNTAIINIFPGNDKELGEYYRDIDFYLCTGRIHPGAFHYPVLEAMSCGTPVISTSYYGIKESTAFILKKNTPEEVVAMIEYAVKNTALTKNKIEAAKKEVAILSWESAGQQLLEILYEKLEYSQTRTRP